VRFQSLGQLNKIPSRRERMGNPVVHFEIIGRDPARLRTFFTKLFEWESDTN